MKKILMSCLLCAFSVSAFGYSSTSDILREVDQESGVVPANNGDVLYYEIVGTFVGSVSAQQSTDGSSWTTLGTVSSPSTGTITCGIPAGGLYRLKCASYTSGGIGVSMYTPYPFGDTVSGVDGDYVTYTTGTIENDETDEPKAFFYESVYNGTGAGTLPAGIWSTLHYNQHGPATTGHGGAIFGRTIAGASVEGFQFGVEGNCWSSSLSTSPTSSAVGVIGHAVYMHDTNTPSAPVIGVNARSEVTDGTITQNRNVGTVVGVRSEVYGGADKYSFVGVGADARFVNDGDIIKVRKPTTALSGGATVDIAGACGGILVITSTGPISTATQAFTAPSATIGSGWNDGCEMTVINGNTTAGRNIKFKYSSTNLATISGSDLTVGPGGSFRIASYPALGVWVQTTAATK